MYAALRAVEVYYLTRLRMGIAAHLSIGQDRDALYEPVLADSEREAVADLLQYLENVCYNHTPGPGRF